MIWEAKPLELEKLVKVDKRGRCRKGWWRGKIKRCPPKSKPLHRLNAWGDDARMFCGSELEMLADT